ncbi:MAG: RuBisCO large subunit C-terminal-like domain-containing protein [Eubacteriales bacterium]|nr:RuBisCO large subunit C-terminal-like domain-containing protein [Eubacteriales bacterium]
MDSVLYAMSENIRKKNFAIATYYIKLPKEADILKKAESLAIGQTIGTWVPIPGITDEIREKYMGKVVNVFDVPPLDLNTQGDGDERHYVIQLAYPTVNFGGDIPLLLTALLGNDASTSAQVKLMDIEFPEEFARKLGGPRFGSEGVRDWLGVRERPLLLSMIKPCTGLTPEAGAKIFYQTALGGADIIKDDELLGNPEYSRPQERVRAYQKAAKAAYEETGEKAAYFVNITSGCGEILENLKRAEEAGADGVMVNFAMTGYSVLKQVAEKAHVPVLGHAAGSGMFFEGTMSGMGSPLAVGKLARLCGSDITMINTPYGGYPLRYQKYMQTAAQLTLPYYEIKASMPSIGGGVHPGMVEKYMKEVGKDIVLAAGGAVHGHPMGAAAGARAMRQAIDAVMQGRRVPEAAKEYQELREALALWGYVEP